MVSVLISRPPCFSVNIIGLSASYSLHPPSFLQVSLWVCVMLESPWVSGLHPPHRTPPHPTRSHAGSSRMCFQREWMVCGEEMQPGSFPVRFPPVVCIPLLKALLGIPAVPWPSWVPLTAQACPSRLELVLVAGLCSSPMVSQDCLHVCH